MEFFRPQSLADASGLLARDPDARCLAGGATLVQQMNAGVLSPSTVVSLAGIASLRELEHRSDGSVRIGAMRCHREIGLESGLAGEHSLLAEAALRIGNPVVRNMGTLGGSLAFADPACDYLPALLVLEAVVELSGPERARELPIADFLSGPYAADLHPGEIVSALRLPPPRAGVSVFYERIARTHGDGAIASVALAVVAGGAPRVAVGGCSPTPVRDPAIEARVGTAKLDAERISALSRDLAEACEPRDDLRASAAYRRALLPRLISHALKRSAQKLRPA